MKDGTKVISAIVAMIMLIPVGAISLYQTLFAVWMTAYPKADIAIWRPRFYLRFSITMLIGIIWLGLAIWAIRKGRKSGKSLAS